MEIDGGIWNGGRHTRPVGYENDVVKLNEAALDGWLVLRATATQVKTGVALNWVRRAFEGVSEGGLG